MYKIIIIIIVIIISFMQGIYTYKVVQIWPGLFVCKQVTVCPGHIWTTLYIPETNYVPREHSVAEINNLITHVVYQEVDIAHANAY